MSHLKSKLLQKDGKGHEDGSTAISTKNEPLLTGEEDEPENNQVIDFKAFCQSTTLMWHPTICLAIV